MEKGSQKVGGGAYGGGGCGGELGGGGGWWCLGGVAGCPASYMSNLYSSEPMGLRSIGEGS